MVGDDDIKSVGVGVVDRFVGGDASIAGEKQFRAALDDGLERLDVNAVAFFSADGDVITHICIQGSQGLNKQCCGCLPINIEVTPDADFFSALDGGSNDVNGFFDIGKLRGWILFGIEKRLGFDGRVDSASEESLRDEGGQAQVLE